jgi:ClpP class serine protease
LFSGEYWTGRQAIELGLADAIGELRSVLRQRFGEDVKTPLIAPERSFFGRQRPGIAVDQFGWSLNSTDFAQDLVSALEARALWGRYGL